MRNLNNKVVAITGAGSGIGRATALRLAQEGCHLALSDINEQGLLETVAEAKKYGHDITHQQLDVADRSSVEQWAQTVVDDHGQVNVIINNAGVALSATIEEMSIEDFEWLMGINFWGVVYGTKSFLPFLKQAEEGHIVNISSVFGIVGIPSVSAYCAAKFAVKGFTESLRQELEIENSHVSCSCVHPGGIKTNIASSARVTEHGTYTPNRDAVVKDFDRLAQSTPEQAAATIVAGLKANKRRVLIGVDAHIIDLYQRFMPTLYQWIGATFVRWRKRNGRSPLS